MAKIDSEDELKRQMRRRLVGAVALATAMVVILPMLLESTPKPAEGGLELRIPDKDRAGRFTSQMVVAESAPEITPETPPAAPPEAAREQPASAPVAEPASAVPPAPEKPAHKPAKAEHQQAARQEHKPAEAAHAAPKAGFAVQVGAFANAATAKELADTLRRHGWHAYTEKAGEAIRVRVGPYSTREGADQARHKLEAQGMHPAVVSEP